MLGLNGVVVKSHGGTDAQGFAYAVDVAMDMVVHRFNDRIREGLHRIGELRSGWGRKMALETETVVDQVSPRQADAARSPSPASEAPTAARSVVAGIGGYLPELAVTNDELAKTVETSDAWIRERTGIRQRHIAQRARNLRVHGDQGGGGGARRCRRGRREVDAIIVATATPDQAFPATAMRVQAALGAGGFGFDVSAACSGFIYALSVADAMIRVGQIRCALVIGSEVYSRIMNWQDRGTCVLFGDGAGAVLLRAGVRTWRRRRSSASCRRICMRDGKLGDILYVDGAVGQPERPGHLVMNGREVFRHAVNRLSESVDEALQANGLTRSDIDWLVPHQANSRIIDASAASSVLGQSR